MNGHRFASVCNLLNHMRTYHGDNPKALTKRKELEVHQLLSQAGLQFEYQRHLPFRGCGLESETQCAFADFVLYAGWGAVILEVDENQHRERDPSCDVRRDFDMAASVALGSAHKLAIARYNPDPFKVAGRTMRTPKKERCSCCTACCRKSRSDSSSAFSCTTTGRPRTASCPPWSQDPAVFGVNGGSPNHVKVAWSELGQRLPGANVRHDGGAGVGVDVKRGDFPPQLLEGSAH